MVARCARSSPIRLRAVASMAAVGLLLVPLVPTATASPPGGAQLAPTPLIFINGSTYAGTEYLIVTTQAYASALQSIATWKTQKGLPARVALLEDVEQSYAGRDSPEKLHNFLQDVYWNGTDKGLKYVLLGGGAAIIPIRYLRVNGSAAVAGGYTHDLVFSDVYYAGLGSDWDRNGDGFYGDFGEEDWDAEVYVGRLPFNSAAEAGFARDNLLSYEKSPFVGSWMSSAVAFASAMDPPNDGILYDPTKDNALLSVQRTQPYLPATMSLQLLADYHELSGGNYSTAQDTLSNVSMVGAINAGKSVVMSVTHGWVPSGRGVPQYIGFDGVAYSWGNGLEYTDAALFTNYGQLSFGYFSSCLVGNFSNPSLPNFGRYVIQDNHGFIAEIIPTDGTLRGENDEDAPGLSVGNWWQSENFWRNFFLGSDPFRPGPALYQGIRDYSAHLRDTSQVESNGGYRLQKAVYNLLGDPEIPIWTEIASTFNASLPSTLYTAEQHFRGTLQDTLGRPAAGALVVLSGGGVYAKGTTDALGRFDIVVAPTTTASLTMTATLHNFIPLQVTVPVQTAPADLSIEPQNVTLPSAVLRTNDPAQVDFTVRNVGQQPAAATEARGYATAPGGLPQLVAPSIFVPALSPGEEFQSSFTWTPSEDGLHAIRVVVDPTNAIAEFDELNNEVTVTVDASGVDLFLGAVTLSPPGQVAPGGVITVSGTLGRTGLVPRDYLVTYELLRADGSAVVTGNAEASTLQSAFSMDVLASESGTFTLRVTADGGRDIIEFNESNNQADFTVKVGQGPAIFALPSVVVDEGAPPTAVITDLRGLVADPDTPFEQLVFQASASAPQLAVWVDGHKLVAHPAAHWSGSGTVTLAVSDGHESSSATTAFTVFPVERPPFVEAPPPQTAVAGEPFVYQIVASDAHGGPLTYSIAGTISGVATGLTANSTGVIAFVPPQESVGLWQLSITVRNAAQLGTTVPFTLSVLPGNAAPELVDLGALTVRRGAGATFTLLARDANGDPVTFSTHSNLVTLLPTGSLQLSAAQVAALPDGQTTIEVTLSDGTTESQGQVTLVTQAAGSAPSASYGSDLAPLAITLAALGAAIAGLAFTLRRRRRPE